MLQYSPIYVPLSEIWDFLSDCSWSICQARLSSHQSKCQKCRTFVWWLAVICRLEIWSSKPPKSLHFTLPLTIITATNILDPWKQKLTKCTRSHQSQSTNMTFWPFCIKQCFFLRCLLWNFAAVKHKTVGWVSNFRVRMLLKSTVILLLPSG